MLSKHRYCQQSRQAPIAAKAGQRRPDHHHCYRPSSL